MRSFCVSGMAPGDVTKCAIRNILVPMLFNSLSFVFFLAIVFCLYWMLGKRVHRQNQLLLVASYAFYGWWDCRFLLLITFTAVWSWGAGLYLKRTGGIRRRKFGVAAALIVNLGILGVFKYFNFFAENAVALLELFGFKAHVSTLNIILPVGISFYTFQSIGYVIDVYRRKVEPTRDLVTFLAFVSFFPQLVAGPIERASNLLPQFLSARRFDYALAVDGCRQMLWGFFKKMVVADGCAPVVDLIFRGHEAYPGSVKLVGALLFTFQIYGDFSGYSDIAVGCARLFGFSLMRNFANPYFSRNIAEFWRRWHISLTTWFRDYVYIPLGGNRCGRAKTIRNVFVTFLVSGLWHGADWTFVLWGSFHACLFLPLILRGANRRVSTYVIAEGRLFPTIRESFQMMATFMLVVLAWILFRAPDAGTAARYAGGIFSSSLFELPRVGLSMFPWLAVLVLVEWLGRDKPHPLFFKGYATDGRRCLHYFRIALYAAIIIVCAAYKAVDSEFIYFQF